MTTIGIISIKGGVGKTSAAASLAAAMANDFKRKILAVDANFSAPTLGEHVGISEPEVTIHHVLDDKAYAQDAVQATEYGFDIIPGARVYGKIDPFKLNEKLRDLKRKYDAIILDSSPNLNEEILATMIACDELIIVTTPDSVTLNSTLNAIRAAKARRTPITGIIINRSYNKNFELSIEDIERASGIKVLAVIPHEVDAVEALSKKIPSSAYKNTEAALEYKKLAGTLIGEDYKEKGIKSFLKMFRKKVPQQEINRAILKRERLVV